MYSPHKVKPRVVLDAAAKFHGVSLNDKLVSGPDLLNSLMVVVLRFRVGEVALAADIEGMFHRVEVNKTMRTVCGFYVRMT